MKQYLNQMTTGVKRTFLWPRKYRKLVYALLSGILVVSIIGWNWYGGASSLINGVQMSLHTHSSTKSLAQYSGNIVLFRILNLNLSLHNPSKYATPGFFVEAPYILVNGSDYEVDCINRTLTAFIGGPSHTSYITECGTPNPIIIGPNETILLTLRVILGGGYNSNQDPHLNGNLAILLRAFMIVREPFFDPQTSPPPFRDRSGNCNCLDITAWITREFYISAIVSE